MAKARRFSLLDIAATEAALIRHREKLAVAGREYASHYGMNASSALRQLLDECTVVIIGDYLVAFQITGAWATPGCRYFDEVLLLRITRTTGNSLRNVVQEMERIARLNGCVGMHLGTFGAYDDRLGRVYQRLGFRPSPTHYYKEITWAI